MAITLNITKNSNAYTNMRIFRATTKEAVYSGAAIADVAIAASYVDASAVDGQVYFYGIELYHATDKTRFPVIKACGISDFGPLTALVQAHLQNFGNYVSQGDANMGVIGRYTLTQLSNIPVPLNTKAKLDELYLAATGNGANNTTGDMSMNLAVVEGKVTVFPSQANLGMHVSSYAAANTAFKTFRDYLVANPDKAVVDIGGYRWKIKAVTKDMLLKYPEMAMQNTSGVALRRLSHMFGETSTTDKLYVYSETDNRAEVFYSSTSGPNFSLETSTSSGSTRRGFVYFEYAGLAPTA